MLSLPFALLLAAQAPNAEPPIVVIGTPETREERHDRAMAFVRRSGVAAGERPVARWVNAVCPRVIGVSPRYAEIVEAGLRRNAAASGIRVGPQDCQPNILVAFGSDANGTMQEIARIAPRHLSEVPVQARAALLGGAAPVRWFYTTEARSRHGMLGGDNAPLFVGGDAPGGGSALPAGIEAFLHYGSSMISTQTVRALDTATVVIDTSAMDRMPLTALIDYASLVAFAELVPSEFSPPGSILGLFGAEPGARALTDWDRAFLRALYRLPLDREGRRHRGILVRELVEAANGGG